MIDFTKYILAFEIELTSANYSKRSIGCYVSCVSKYLEYFNEYPNRINADEIKQYIANILKQGYSPEYATQVISSLKKLYKLVVKQPKKLNGIASPKKQIKLTEPLSVNEIIRLIGCIENIKHKAIVVVMYYSGLRVSEVLNLQWKHLQRDRQMLIIKQAKGNKDRYVKLYPEVITVLEKYWYNYKTTNYIFEGQCGGEYSASSIRNFLKAYSKKAGLHKICYPHLLRHSFFCHLHEKGVDLRTLQGIAGHKSSKTTERYTFISNRFLVSVPSPI